jgi:Protein of unknown function (DUF2726)
MWILFLLVVIAAIAIFVWDFRKKAAAREAASKKRFEEMFMARSGAAAQPAPTASPATAVTSPPAATPELKPAPVAVAAAPSRDRFLGKGETLVYRLLKAGIPDHEIFANVTLAAVIGGKNEQDTRRLSQYRLDFVVCDKDMRVVAAIDVETGSGAHAAGEQRFVADSLKAAGIGLVRINMTALPRREEIRPGNRSGLLLANSGVYGYLSPRSRSSGALLIRSASPVRVQRLQFSTTYLDLFAWCGDARVHFNLFRRVVWQLVL